MKRSPYSRQRGIATVAVTLMLSLAVILGVAYASRSVRFEARTADNHYRAAQAHEAAEAGVHWVLARLNDLTPLGADCLPSRATTARPFRDLVATEFHAACVANDPGWTCRCDGVDAAPQATDDDSAPGFSVHLSAVSGDASLHLTSTGASSGSRAGSSASRSTVQVQIGRLPGLDAMPSAALTVRGASRFGTTAFGIHHINADSGGLTLFGGGVVDGPLPWLQSAPGTPPGASVLTSDADLAALTPRGLFASLFRMDKAAWRHQPIVRSVDCHRACDAALSAAATTHPLIWLDGGLTLDEPAQLGSPEHPVLLIADGPVSLSANVVIHGLVYGTHAEWLDTAGAEIHGAVVIEGDFTAQAATQIHHDRGVLRALHQHTGTYARVHDSWLDH